MSAPTVNFLAANFIGPNSAILNGLIVSSSPAITSYGFHWGTTASYGRTETIAGTISASTAYSIPISGLIPSTTYHFRTWATNGVTGVSADTFLITPAVVTHPNVTGPNWTYRLDITFQDEFDSPISLYDSTLNIGTWRTWFYWGSQTNPAARGESAVSCIFSDEKYNGINPFTIGNSQLFITADNNPNSGLLPGNDGLPFTSGTITTQNSFNQTYGYFECRCRTTPMGLGIWPAFWMLSNLYGATEEIDTMECFATQNQTSSGIHYSRTLPHSNPLFYHTVADTTQFHTYGFLWTQDSLVFFVDDVLVSSIPNPGIDDDEYLIATLQTGAVGSFLGYPTQDEIPCLMIIDYIRAYSITPVSPSTPLPSFVQSQSFANATSDTLISSVFPSPQTLGNCNVVCVSFTATTTTNISSVTDTAGNVYARIVPEFIDTSYSHVMSVYVAKNIRSSTANIVTVTFNTGRTNRNIQILEYTGIDLNQPTDGFSVNSFSNGDNALQPQCPSVTTTRINDKIVTFLTIQSSVGVTIPSGFTSRISTAVDFVADGNATNVGTYFPRWLLSGSRSNVVAQVILTSSPVAPILKTLAANFITTNSANLNGLILGASPNITSYGFNWGTTKSYGHVESITGILNPNQGYSIPISGLSPNTTYYFQAWATNSFETGYTTDATFITPPIVTHPTVTGSLSGINSSYSLNITFQDEFDSPLSLYDSVTNIGTWRTWFYWGDQNNPGARGESAVSCIFSDAKYNGINPFSISNSQLTITADNNPNSGLLPGNDGLPFTSGAITTQNSFNQTYGYFECRCRTIPMGVGIWPAFWMLSNLYEATEEIDIMECFATQNQTSSGIHYSRTLPHSNPLFYHTVADTSQFHTYGLLWTATALCFYIDDVQVSSIPNPGIDDDEYLIANLQTGAVGSFLGYPTADEIPDTMVIDYIRAYSLTPASSATFTNFQTQGNTNIVWVWTSDSNSITSVTDTAGNPYSLIQGPIVVGPNAAWQVAVYVSNNISAYPAGLNQVTATLAIDTWSEMIIEEYTWVSDVTPVERTSNNSGVQTTTGSSTLTTTTPSDSVISWLGVIFPSGVVTPPPTYSLATNTNTADIDHPVSGTSFTAYKVLTSPGATTPTWTFPINNWTVLDIALKGTPLALIKTVTSGSVIIRRSFRSDPTASSVSSSESFIREFSRPKPAALISGSSTSQVRGSSAPLSPITRAFCVSNSAANFHKIYFPIPHALSVSSAVIVQIRFGRHITLLSSSSGSALVFTPLRRFYRPHPISSSAGSSADAFHRMQRSIPSGSALTTSSATVEIIGNARISTPAVIVPTAIATPRKFFRPKPVPIILASSVAALEKALETHANGSSSFYGSVQVSPSLRVTAVGNSTSASVVFNSSSDHPSPDGSILSSTIATRRRLYRPGKAAASTTFAFANLSSSSGIARTTPHAALGSSASAPFRFVRLPSPKAVVFSAGAVSIRVVTRIASRAFMVLAGSASLSSIFRQTTQAASISISIVKRSAIRTFPAAFSLSSSSASVTGPLLVFPRPSAAELSSASGSFHKLFKSRTVASITFSATAHLELVPSQHVSAMIASLSATIVTGTARHIPSAATDASSAAVITRTARHIPAAATDSSTVAVITRLVRLIPSGGVTSSAAVAEVSLLKRRTARAVVLTAGYPTAPIKCYRSIPNSAVSTAALVSLELFARPKPTVTISSVSLVLVHSPVVARVAAVGYIQMDGVVSNHLLSRSGVLAISASSSSVHVNIVRRPLAPARSVSSSNALTKSVKTIGFSAIAGSQSTQSVERYSKPAPSATILSVSGVSITGPSIRYPRPLASSASSGSVSMRIFCRPFPRGTVSLISSGQIDQPFRIPAIAGIASSSSSAVTLNDSSITRPSPTIIDGSSSSVILRTVLLPGATAIIISQSSVNRSRVFEQKLSAFAVVNGIVVHREFYRNKLNPDVSSSASVRLMGATTGPADNMRVQIEVLDRWRGRIHVL